MDDDEDVVMEGSALHQHLIESGFESDMTVNSSSVIGDEGPYENISYQHGQEERGSGSGLKVKEEHCEVITKLKLRIANLILEKGLLVHEDEEFIKHFILDDTKEQNNKPDAVNGLVSSVCASSIFLSSLIYSYRQRLSFSTISLPIASGAALATLLFRKYLSKPTLESAIEDLLSIIDQTRSVLNQVTSITFRKSLNKEIIDINRASSS